VLYEQFDFADTEPLDGGLRWLVPALVAAAAASGALLFYLVGQSLFAGIFLAGFVAMLVASFVIDRRTPKAVEVAPLLLPDMELMGSAIALSADAVALTDASGALRSVNPAYRSLLETTRPPLELGANAKAGKALLRARDLALRDGKAELADLALAGGISSVGVTRVGAQKDLLLWRFMGADRLDPIDIAAQGIAGATGEQLASAGVLAALIDDEGQLVAVNRPFADRALAGAPAPGQAVQFGRLVESSPDGTLRLVAEGADARPLRAVHVPLDVEREGGAGTFLMFESNEGASLANSTNVQVLLEMLPIGLALVDRDGRFLTMNKAFRVAGGLKTDEMPAYPGDLVVKEDKAAVADAVRRNARGPAMSGDLPVRLAHQPAEPVALTVAGLRGLGDAAVLLLLKDNSEEAKLKRQVAQATKMQAVGQLAGGVAHDFNNILTAIIGHCDLMMMRHTPGDSD
jgi:two-component system cell cycle sensor histidine kinase/response regulator CckA